VLTLIAAGHNESPSDYHERLDEIKRRHPKAYERWTDAEDAALAAMHREHKTIGEMAARFQRELSAIRSRLAKLNLVPSGE
jgi:hypothetical protein